jgi:hypothetical protein
MGITIAVSLVLMLLTPAAYAQRPSIAQLQSDLAALQVQLNNLEGIEFGSYLTIDETIPSRPVVRVAGANLQVVNGVDSSTINGLGNLIVGYDDPRTAGAESCSNGLFHDDMASCVGTFSTWALNHKNGSHNVIIGQEHNYSSRNGLLAGKRNMVSSSGASVSGGTDNVAGAPWSNVSGGTRNLTQGGFGASSISGGDGNTATGSVASISGGLNNTASGDHSSVSGGENRSVTGDNNWRAGNLFEDN